MDGSLRLCIPVMPELIAILYMPPSACGRRVCTFKPSSWRSKRKKTYFTSPLIKWLSRNRHLLKTAGASPRNAFKSKPREALSRGFSIVAQISWPNRIGLYRFRRPEVGLSSLVENRSFFKSLEQAAAVLGETMHMNTEQFAIVCEPPKTNFALRSV
jgi:hypothetical protein